RGRDRAHRRLLPVDQESTTGTLYGFLLFASIGLRIELHPGDDVTRQAIDQDDLPVDVVNKPLGGGARREGRRMDAVAVEDGDDGRGGQRSAERGVPNSPPAHVLHLSHAVYLVRRKGDVGPRNP